MFLNTLLKKLIPFIRQNCLQDEEECSQIIFVTNSLPIVIAF